MRLRGCIQNGIRHIPVLVLCVKHGTIGRGHSQPAREKMESSKFPRSCNEASDANHATSAQCLNRQPPPCFLVKQYNSKRSRFSSLNQKALHRSHAFHGLQQRCGDTIHCYTQSHLQILTPCLEVFVLYFQKHLGLCGHLPSVAGFAIADGLNN